MMTKKEWRAFVLFAVMFVGVMFILPILGVKAV